MKNILLFTFLLLYASGWIESCDPPQSEPPCDSTLWAHTYGAMGRFANPPQRLVLHHRCVTITGRVESLSNEADGDLKIKLSLSPENFKPYGPFENKDEILYKNANDRLVVEVVCVFPENIIEAQNKEPDPVKKTYYQGMIDACARYKNKVTIPKLYDKIGVTGELLMDTGPSKAHPVQDHGWNEIHPVTRITILTKPGDPLTEVR
jgi:hypothetical protein